MRREYPFTFFRYRNEKWEQLQKIKHIPLVIVPKEDFILIPALRLRISLENASINRRRERILYRSVKEGKTRTLLFKFHSITDCADFTDQLVQLNPKLREKPKLGKEVTSQTVSNIISQLLLDPDFRAFVDKIENAVVSTNDGEKLLQNLANRSE